MDKELMRYLNDIILPKYDNFDKGHDRRHIGMVEKYALEICDEIGYKNKDLITTAVYYHDLGLIYNDRENHHILSSKLVMDDKNLIKFFTYREIELISTIVKEHRTVLEKTTLESKIVADADKLDSVLEIDRMFERSIQYNIGKNISNKESLFNEVYDHLKNKYGKAGMMKLCLDEVYFKYRNNKKYVEKILHDDLMSRSKFNEIYNKISMG